MSGREVAWLFAGYIHNVCVCVGGGFGVGEVRRSTGVREARTSADG